MISVLEQKIRTYTPSDAALETIRDVPLLFAVGISGAGKDTILKQLMARYPNDYQFLVTSTTRKPRKNDNVMEQDGVDYYFIDTATAERMLAEGRYLETNYYANNIYGASIDEIARVGKQGKILISDIDVNGVANVMRHKMNAKPIFILPPSYEVWQERLHSRYGNIEFDHNDFRKRMQTALAELQMALDNVYYYIVINDDIDKTVALVNDIAHGKPVEARYPRAIELTKQIANKVQAQLDQLAVS